jgi:glycosyltransferase involved in cell wall biosynthesis
MISLIPDNHQPAVSVVIPSYNTLQYLPHAFNSILAQPSVDLEVIVADDGSTDATWAWLQSMAKQHIQLRPIMTDGVGPAEARNRCIAQARGEYVAFLDADDRWRPGKLVAQLNFHRSHPDLVFSFTDYRCVNTQGEALGDCYDYWRNFRRIANRTTGYRLLEDAQAVLFAENPVGTSSVMVKRQALLSVAGFDPSLPSAEDWELWLRLTEQGPVGFTDQLGMEYLMRADSESAKSEVRLKALNIIYERYVEKVARVNRSSPRIARARMAVARAEQMRIKQDYRHALLEHLKAFSLFPNGQTLKAAAVDVRRVVLGNS